MPDRGRRGLPPALHGGPLIQRVLPNLESQIHKRDDNRRAAHDRADGCEVGKRHRYPRFRCCRLTPQIEAATRTAVRLEFARRFRKTEQRVTFRAPQKRHASDADDADPDSGRRRYVAPERVQARHRQSRGRRQHGDRQKHLVLPQYAHCPVPGILWRNGRNPPPILSGQRRPRTTGSGAAGSDRIRQSATPLQGADVISGLPVSKFTGTETCSSTMSHLPSILRYTSVTRTVKSTGFPLVSVPVTCWMLWP